MASKFMSVEISNYSFVTFLRDPSYFLETNVLLLINDSLFTGKKKWNHEVLCFKTENLENFFFHFC